MPQKYVEVDAFKMDPCMSTTCTNYISWREVMKTSSPY